MTDFVRIDNQIVERLACGGIAIGPIRLYKKRHWVKLDLQSVPFVFTGSRLSDSLFMQRLLHSDDPAQSFDNLPVVFPGCAPLLK